MFKSAPMSAFIPEELLFTEVLIRLPLKSLARFRCVSKSWKAQIDNPLFVKMHFDRTKDSDLAEVRILVGGSHYGAYKLYSIDVHDSLIFDLDEVCSKRAKEIKISHKLEHHIYELHDYYGCQILGSCYGLICLGLLSRTAPLALTFMNPLTQKNWDLPQFPKRYSGGTYYGYGFGYNEVTDDYMLVVLVENPSIKIIVYSLKSNSWRRVLDSPFEGATASVNQLRGVFAGKALHWVVRNWDSMATFIAAFDLQTEQFYSMQFPEYPDGSIHWQISLGNLGGCLSAVFHSRSETFVVDLWVMKDYGVEDSWTMFTLKLPIYGLYTAVIPIALFKGYHVQVLLQISSNCFKSNSNYLLLYNLQTRSALFLRNPAAFFTLGACVCTGSLLLPSGARKKRGRKSYFRWSWPLLNRTQSMEKAKLLDSTAGAADKS